VDGLVEGPVERLVRDAGPAGLLGVTHDPDGAGQRPQPEVMPGDLSPRVLVDADEGARIPDSNRPDLTQSSGPYRRHLVPGDGVERFRRREHDRPGVNIHVKQGGVVPVDAPAGPGLAQLVDGLP
jgi:hypothetical protein